jgi:curved DNA-binding protein CbpA
MSELLKAYTVLGLEPGSNKESIQTRYKRLIMVWHPDRFPTAEGKLDAEEELKKILNAKELLIKHFDSGKHKGSTCECSRTGASQTNSSPPSAKPSGGTRPRESFPGHSPGPGRARNTPPPYPGGRKSSFESNQNQPSEDQLKRWAQLERELEYEERSDEIKVQKAAVEWLLDQQKEEQEAKAPKPKKKQKPTLQDLLDAAKDGKAPAKVQLMKEKTGSSEEMNIPFIDEWKSIVTSPVSFFEQMPIDGSLKAPLLFVLTMSAVNAIFWFLTDIIHPIHALFSAVIGFIALAGGSFLLTATTKAICKPLGGNGTFKHTYYACAYACAPNILLFAPLINCFAVLYSAFLLKLALEHVQELTPGRSSAVVAIQLLVAVIIGTQVAISGTLTALETIIPNDVRALSGNHEHP